MFDLLFITSIVGSCVQLFKEATSKKVPAENWANKELYYQDMTNGMSSKQLMKNVENGRYRLENVNIDFEKHPEPHKNPVTGQIIIENCTLYREDLRNHGSVQTMKWVKQGKYNLTQEELKNERERLKNYLTN